MDEVLKQMDKVIAWQNEYFGMQRMQTMVLNWLVANQPQLPEPLVLDLVAHMDGAMATERAGRPALAPKVPA